MASAPAQQPVPQAPPRQEVTSGQTQEAEAQPPHQLGQRQEPASALGPHPIGARGASSGGDVGERALAGRPDVAAVSAMSERTGGAANSQLDASPADYSNSAVGVGAENQHSSSLSGGTMSSGTGVYDGSERCGVGKQEAAAIMVSGDHRQPSRCQSDSTEGDASGPRPPAACLEASCVGTPSGGPSERAATASTPQRPAEHHEGGEPAGESKPTVKLIPPERALRPAGEASSRPEAAAEAAASAAQGGAACEGGEDLAAGAGDGLCSSGCCGPNATVPAAGSRGAVGNKPARLETASTFQHEVPEAAAQRQPAQTAASTDDVALGAPDRQAPFPPSPRKVDALADLPSAAGARPAPVPPQWPVTNGAPWPQPHGKGPTYGHEQHAYPHQSQLRSGPGASHMPHLPPHLPHHGAHHGGQALPNGKVRNGEVAADPGLLTQQLLMPFLGHYTPPGQSPTGTSPPVQGQPAVQGRMPVNGLEAAFWQNLLLSKQGGGVQPPPPPQGSQGQAVQAAMYGWQHQHAHHQQLYAGQQAQLQAQAQAQAQAQQQQLMQQVVQQHLYQQHLLQQAAQQQQAVHGSAHMHTGQGEPHSGAAALQTESGSGPATSTPAPAPQAQPQPVVVLPPPEPGATCPDAPVAQLGGSAPPPPSVLPQQAAQGSAGAPLVAVQVPAAGSEGAASTSWETASTSSVRSEPAGPPAPQLSERPMGHQHRVQSQGNMLAAAHGAPGAGGPQGGGRDGGGRASSSYRGRSSYTGMGGGAPSSGMLQGGGGGPYGGRQYGGGRHNSGPQGYVRGGRYDTGGSADSSRPSSRGPNPYGGGGGGGHCRQPHSADPVPPPEALPLPEPKGSCDLDRFISQIEPFIAIDPDKPPQQALQELRLRDLWNFYFEPSLYGREVFTLGGHRGASNSYFVPYLSAIQIFTATLPTDVGGTSRLYVSEDGHGWPKHMHLKFEYFEQELPFNRLPLYDQIELLSNAMAAAAAAAAAAGAGGASAGSVSAPVGAAAAARPAVPPAGAAPASTKAQPSAPTAAPAAVAAMSSAVAAGGPASASAPATPSSVAGSSAAGSARGSETGEEGGARGALTAALASEAPAAAGSAGQGGSGEAGTAESASAARVDSDAAGSSEVAEGASSAGSQRQSESGQGQVQPEAGSSASAVVAADIPADAKVGTSPTAAGAEAHATAGTAAAAAATDAAPATGGAASSSSSGGGAGAGAPGAGAAPGTTAAAAAGGASGGGGGGAAAGSRLLYDMRLVDVHPASWFAVAWYPVYRIPDAPLYARFLTFHSFAPLVESMRNAHERLAMGQLAPYHLLSLPVVGLNWYNMQGERWLEPLDESAVAAAAAHMQQHGTVPPSPAASTPGTMGGSARAPPHRGGGGHGRAPGADVWYQQLLHNYQVNADRLARGLGLKVLGREGMEDVRLRVPDYEFFRARGP